MAVGYHFSSPSDTYTYTVTCVMRDEDVIKQMRVMIKCIDTPPMGGLSFALKICHFH